MCSRWACSCSIIGIPVDFLYSSPKADSLIASLSRCHHFCHAPSAQDRPPLCDCHIGLLYRDETVARILYLNKPSLLHNILQ
jgi:hypothetical protein